MMKTNETTGAIHQIPSPDRITKVAGPIPARAFDQSSASGTLLKIKGRVEHFVPVGGGQGGRSKAGLDVSLMFVRIKENR